jgi:hypothetical protein
MTEHDQAEQSQVSGSKPMTRFQKVASALRGDNPDQEQAEDGMDARQDYWEDDRNKADRDGATAVTRPAGLGPDAADPGTPAEADRAPEADRAVEADGMAEADGAGSVDEDQAATQPDIFGTGARPDPGETPATAEAVTPEAVTPGVVIPGAVIPGAVAPEVPAEGRHAATPADVPAGTPASLPANGELRPGEATDAFDDFSDIAYGKLIPEAAEFRQQWQQIQFNFVDDPRGSVTEAADVVAQVTARLEAAIAERQRIIAERQRSLRSKWAEGSNADTETLRGTLQMYRAFLDQLLGTRG